MPDAKGHEPKRSEKNSCGVMQQHINKLLSNGSDLSTMVHKQLVHIYLGGGGGVNGPHQGHM